MTDALSLIREYTIAKKQIEKRDGLVYLGDFCWDLKSETNYMVYGTGRDGNPKGMILPNGVLKRYIGTILKHPQNERVSLRRSLTHLIRCFSVYNSDFVSLCIAALTQTVCMGVFQNYTNVHQGDREVFFRISFLVKSLSRILFN